MFDLTPGPLPPPPLRRETAPTRLDEKTKATSETSSIAPAYESIKTSLDKIEASKVQEEASAKKAEPNIDLSLPKEETLAPLSDSTAPEKGSYDSKIAIQAKTEADRVLPIEPHRIESPKSEIALEQASSTPPVKFVETEKFPMNDTLEKSEAENKAPVRSAKDKLARLLGKGDFEAAKVNGPDLVDDSEYMKPNWGAAPNISIFDMPGEVAFPLDISTKTSTPAITADDSPKLREQRISEIEALRTELRSQLKWEAVRLQEAVRSQLVEDKKVAAKEASVMAQKHSEELARVREDAVKHAEKVLMERTRKIKQEAEKQRDDELSIILKEKEAELRETLSTEYAELRRTETEKRELALVAAEANVSAMSDKFDALVTQTEKAKEAAKRASSAFMLRDSVAASQPLGSLLKEATGDGLGELVAASIPSAAVSNGVLSLDGLKNNFKRASKRGLSAALVPENKQGTIWGHFLGSIFSRLKIPVDFRLFSDQPPQTNEERIRLAQNLLNEGDLGGAVAILESLDGLAGEVMSDWMCSAKARIAAELAAEVLLADAIIAQIALTKGDEVTTMSA